MKLSVFCAYDELWPLAKLVENPKNPNTHPEKQIQLLAKMIEARGWRAPITVSERSGFVVRGHGRLAAARLLNLDEAPVDIQHYETEAEEYADMIADNQIAELSEIDEEVLSKLVAELNDMNYNTGLLGFSDKEIKEMLSSASQSEVHEDDFDPEKEAESITTPKTAAGNVWQLGVHRLMCGDSTKQEDVDKLMNGLKADMVFTDPPYNIAYEGGTKDKLTIQNDNMSDGEFHNFLLKTFSCMYRASEPGAAIYICHADSEGLNFRSAMQEAGWLFKQCLIWCKNTFTLGRQDYQWSHEPIYYGWKPGAAHTFFGGRKQGTTIGANFPVTVSQDVDGGTLLTLYVGLKSLVLKVPSYAVLDTSDIQTVWEVDKPTRNGDHPTMKPITLVAKALLNSSSAGQNVLDLFGGSGSTLIACEQTKRRCFTMELDPKYCDVIIKRWEKETGNKAVLL